MGKQLKRAKRTLVAESRAYRRALANQHLRKRNLKGIGEYIAMKASDWPNYVRTFFATWGSALASVDGAAETILTNQSVILTQKVWEGLLSPYLPFHLFYFARLMDHFSLDEESRYAELCARLGGAWQKFFASVLVRHPDLRETVDRIAENRRVAQEEVVNLFMGETQPILTPRWACAVTALENDFTVLSEGLRK